MNSEAKTRIIILMNNIRITGSIDLLPGVRISDYLTECREFMAVTDAEVWNLEGRKLLASGFMDVNRGHIDMIMPEDSLTQGFGRSFA
ncbi:MAG: hypothetical protein NT159_22815 [Proteobacteria bacterium]|nr:hypothetical protein [Pseudomonadota bacterium]